MPHATMFGPEDRASHDAGASAHQETLAWELAEALHDLDGIIRYRGYCRQYPEELLRKVLSETNQGSAGQDKKGRIALFEHLLHYYAHGTTENPGN